MSITTFESLTLNSFGHLGIWDSSQLVSRGFFLSLHDSPYLQIRNIVEHHIKPAAVCEIII